MKPKIPRRQLDVPAPAALRTMIDAAGTELLAYLLVAADTGARRGEVSALRWSDLDLIGRAVTINRSVTTTGIVKSTKTDRERQVALAARIVSALEAHRLEQAETALGFGVKVPPSAHVFPHFDRDGFDFATPWRPHSWSHRVRRLRTQLELGPEVTIRNLRHYVATNMLTSGVDVRTVAGRLGHATPATTLNVYAHFQPAADRAAADILARALEDDG